MTVPVGNALADNTITLNNLPSGGSQYSQMRVYRTAAGGSDFFLHGSTAAGGSYVDSSTTLTTTPLDSAPLNGNYSYMVTYYRASEGESRPSPLLGPQNIVNGRVFLGNLPTPPVPPPGGGFPAYDQIRIYRNLNNDPNNFYLVDTVAPGSSYTDSRTDAEISNLTVIGNKKVDLDGPVIDSNTLLINVTKRNGFDYENPFEVGTLAFKGRKGGRLSEEKKLEITATTTIQDLKEFLEDSMGIVTDSGDSANPILNSLNTIPGETGTISPGSFIVNGRLRLVANTGVDNALDIDLTSFRLTDPLQNVSTPNLAFGSSQKAKGQSAVADFIAYDSLGLPIRVRMTAALESRTDSRTTYRWYADSPDNIQRGDPNITVGTGLMHFDGNGNFISSTNDTVAINRGRFAKYQTASIPTEDG